MADFNDTPIRNRMAELDSALQSKLVPVTLPATFKGKFENIQQAEMVEEGPERGHWAMVNGKRTWIEGQHCYPRQQNPRTNEHINKTVILNRNIKLEPLEDNGDLIASSDAASSTRASPIVVKYGKTVKVVRGDYWEQVAAQALREAKTRLFKQAVANGEYDNSI